MKNQIMYFSFWISFLTFSVIPGIYADFSDDVLKEHNRLRKKHGCPDLKLDEELSKGCQTYATTLAEMDTMQHSSGDYGENLCFTTGDKLKCVQDWYNEIRDYDFKKPQFSLKTGHFTALVWKASTDLGVGFATNEASKKTYVVARYKPAGNVRGQFEENVPRPNGSESMFSANRALIPIIVLMLFSWWFNKALN